MRHPICIFEDNHSQKIYPLTLTRPVFELRCGILTLREKIQQAFSGHPINLFCRSYLAALLQLENPGAAVNQLHADHCLFINGRLILDHSLLETLMPADEQLFLYQGEVVGAFLKGERIKRFLEALSTDSLSGVFPNIAAIELPQANLVHYPWEIVNQNPAEITRDFHNLCKGGSIEGRVSQHAVLENESDIYIGKNAIIKPGVVLDAAAGPIYIAANANIMANSVIEGPCFIGENSLVKMGAKIYSGTSIGPFCKIGGEIEASIIHSYSNKQHEGFLGHAYLGQWVNLGADTNNSDLKNNYNSVKVRLNGKTIDSGTTFVGMFIGDHSKSGINTMFNTGTTVGVMCNIFGANFPPTDLPSYCWGSSDRFVEHQLSKALDTARKVMARRNQRFTTVHKTLFKYLFEQTARERNALITLPRDSESG